VGFAVAIVVFALSYFRGVSATVFQKAIQLQSGHVRITAPDYAKKEILRPLNITLPNEKILCDSLERLPSVVIASPRITFWGFLETNEVSRIKPHSGLGIDFEKENGILRPNEILKAGRTPRPNSYEVFLGDLLREELAVEVGDTIWIWALTSRRGLYAMDLVVSGTFGTDINPVDRNTFILPIRTAQELLDMPDRSTEILLMTNDMHHAEAVAQLVPNYVPNWEGLELEVIPWTKQGGMVQALSQLDVMIGFLIAIFMILAGSTIANTMLMSVLERRKEIGMMKALGVGNKSIIFLVVMEALMIGVIGGIIGGAVGSGVAMWTESVGIQLGDAMANFDMPIGNALYPDFRWNYLMVGILAGIFFSGLAALYPAIKAAKVPAAVTMKMA
jgi:ABC-type lipoprotein release transport system permease subunit